MGFVLLAEPLRMLIQPTPGLRRWAAELWEAVPRASADFEPVTAELLAQELQTLEPTITRVLTGKVARTLRGDLRLETLIDVATGD